MRKNIYYYTAMHKKRPMLCINTQEEDICYILDLVSKLRDFSFLANFLLCIYESIYKNTENVFEFLNKITH